MFLKKSLKTKLIIHLILISHLPWFNDRLLFHYIWSWFFTFFCPPRFALNVLCGFLFPRLLLPSLFFSQTSFMLDYNSIPLCFFFFWNSTYSYWSSFPLCENITSLNLYSPLVILFSTSNTIIAFLYSLFLSGWENYKKLAKQWSSLAINYHSS